VSECVFVYLAGTKCSFCLPHFYAFYFVLSDLMISPTWYTFVYLIFCVSTVRLPYLCVNILLMYLASKQVVPYHPPELRGILATSWWPLVPATAQIWLSKRKSMILWISLLFSRKNAVIKHRQTQTQHFLFPHTCWLSRRKNSELNWVCFHIEIEAPVVIDCSHCWRRWTRS